MNHHRSRALRSMPTEAELRRVAFAEDRRARPVVHVPPRFERFDPRRHRTTVASE